LTDLPRLFLRFDAVRFLAPNEQEFDDPALESSLPLALYVNAFDDDGDVYLLGTISGVVIEGPDVREDGTFAPLSTVVVDFADIDYIIDDLPSEVALASIEIGFGALGAGTAIITAPRAWHGVP
jgi:hypothetical protein